MSRLWSIIQAHLDEYGVREAALARRMDMPAQTLNSWKIRGLRQLPDRVTLEAVARETRTSYDVVLVAVLTDTGYLPDTGGGEHARSAPNTDAGATPADEDMVTVEATEPDPSLGLGEEASPEPSRDPHRQGRV